MTSDIFYNSSRIPVGIPDGILVGILVGILIILYVRQTLGSAESALMELQNQRHPFQAQMPSHFIDMSPLHCEKMS